MRVPAQTGATVQTSNPFGSTQPFLQQANQGTAQTLGEVAQDLKTTGQAIGGALAEQEKADAEQRKAALAAAEAEKKRARELMIADGLVDVQRRANDDEVKFRSQQGLNALKASGPALDKLDKHIEDVGARFTDPLLRAEFDVRAKQAILGSRKSMEEHTSKEYASGIKQTYANLHDQAVRTAGSVELSPEEMSLTLAPVDQGADEFMSPEEAKAAKLELRGDVSAAMIERRANTGKIAEAEEQLKLDRALLGDKRVARLQETIDSKKKEQTGKQVAVAVNAVADEVRDENNIVMPTEFKSKLPKMSADDPRREAYEAAIEKQQAIEKKRMDELVDFEVNNASVAIDDGVPIPDKTVKRLRKYDNEKLRGLLDKEEARKRAARTEREGSARDRREAQKAQADINAEAEERFAAELIRNPNANHRDFIIKFTRDVSAREGRPVTVSPKFEAKLERDSEDAKRDDGSDKSKAKAKFAGDIESKIDGLTVTKKGGKADYELTKEWSGYAAHVYEEQVRQNGGKPLTAEQEKAIGAQIIDKAVNGKKTVQKPPPQPAGPVYQPNQLGQKKVKSYGYSADRKTRIPRYEDDSLGDPEPVP